MKKIDSSSSHVNSSVIRVFPRRTKATPIDPFVVIGNGPGFFDSPSQVLISVSFSVDIPFAEKLAYQWESVAPVALGGPAYGSFGGDFVPGKFLKFGYVITSRGCPNSCWFCDVPKIEGNLVRELPITEGWNLLDDNILACSDRHVSEVFTMLKKSSKKYQKPIQFSGGLEAARLTDFHVNELIKIKPKQLFFAYDTPDDLDPLIVAGQKLLDAGFTLSSKCLRAYVLCGYPSDTFQKADRRIKETLSAGFLPMAMLYRHDKHPVNKAWEKWQRLNCRPAFMSPAVVSSSLAMSVNS